MRSLANAPTPTWRSPIVTVNVPSGEEATTVPSLPGSKAGLSPGQAEAELGGQIVQNEGFLPQQEAEGKFGAASVMCFLLFALMLLAACRKVAMPGKTQAGNHPYPKVDGEECHSDGVDGEE